METIKFYVMITWAPDSKEWKFLEKQCPGGEMRWGNIELVENFDEADVYIALWGTHSKTREHISNRITRNCPPKSVIHFNRERHLLSPARRVENEMAKQTLATYWLKDGGINPQKWWVGKTYDELKDVPFPEKSKDVSVILTGYQSMQGHRDRTRFLVAFTNKYPGVLDVYGRQDGQFNLKRLNGYLGYIEDKWDGLAPYRYSMAFENEYVDNVFDEKLVDCFMAGCMPLYKGCSNLLDYFPEGSFVDLDITKAGAVDEVQRIMKSEFRDKHLDELMEAKRLVLNKYQEWPLFHKVINELGVGKRRR